MLEKVPRWLGSALSNVRAGHDKLTLAQLDLSNAKEIRLSSPAFAPGARLPDRFTADGDGVSPPLYWEEPPAGTSALALIVEDPDAPAPRPLVHAVLLDINPALHELTEGAIVADGHGDATKNVGRNSFLSEGWLPPDPPTGHGAHDYVFQLFALGPGEASDEARPGRSDLAAQLSARKVLGAGVLVGTYSRGETAEVGPASAFPAPA